MFITNYATCDKKSFTQPYEKLIIFINVILCCFMHHYNVTNACGFDDDQNMCLKAC